MNCKIVHSLNAWVNERKRACVRRLSYLRPEQLILSSSVQIEVYSLSCNARFESIESYYV